MKATNAATLKSYPGFWLFGFLCLTILGSIGFSSVFPVYKFTLPFTTDPEIPGSGFVVHIPISILWASLISGMISAFAYICGSYKYWSVRLVCGILAIISVGIAAWGDGMSGYQLATLKGGDIHDTRQATAVTVALESKLEMERMELDRLQDQLLTHRASSLVMDNDGNGKNDHLIVGEVAKAEVLEKMIAEKVARINEISDDVASARTTEVLANNSENVFLQIAREKTKAIDGEASETGVAMAMAKWFGLICAVPELGMAILALLSGIKARLKREEKIETKKKEIPPKRSHEVSLTTHIDEKMPKMDDIFKGRLNRDDAVRVPVEGGMGNLLFQRDTQDDQPGEEDEPRCSTMDDQDVIVQRITEPTGIDKERRDVRKLNKGRKLDRYYKSEEISQMNRRALQRLIQYAIDKHGSKVQAIPDRRMLPA